MGRRKNAVWELPENSCNTEQAQLGVLMDIRDELQTLNKNISSVMFGLNQLPSIDRSLSRIDRRLMKRIKL